MLSHFSCVQFSVTPWTVGHQAALPMGFSRQEYWSGLPCPPPGDLPDPGMEPVFPESPALQTDSLPPSHLGSPVLASIIQQSDSVIYIYIYIYIYILFHIFSTVVYYRILTIVNSQYCKYQWHLVVYPFHI